MVPLLSKIGFQFKKKLNRCSGGESVRGVRSPSHGEFAVDQLAEELTNALMTVLGQSKEVGRTVGGQEQA
jgi:hypothetical protein